MHFRLQHPGTYEVTSLTDAHGCIGSDFGSQAVISNYPPLAKPVIDVTGPTTFCEGSSVNLSTSLAGSFAIWSTGETSYSIVVSEAGDYNVKIIDNHNCVSPVSDNTHVTVNKVPRKPIGHNREYLSLSKCSHFRFIHVFSLCHILCLEYISGRSRFVFTAIRLR